MSYNILYFSFITSYYFFLYYSIKFIKYVCTEFDTKNRTIYAIKNIKIKIKSIKKKNKLMNKLKNKLKNKIYYNKFINHSGTC